MEFCQGGNAETLEQMEFANKYLSRDDWLRGSENNTNHYELIKTLDGKLSTDEGKRDNSLRDDQQNNRFNKLEAFWIQDLNSVGRGRVEKISKEEEIFSNTCFPSKRTEKEYNALSRSYCR